MWSASHTAYHSSYLAACFLMRWKALSSPILVAKTARAIYAPSTTSGMRPTCCCIIGINLSQEHNSTFGIFLRRRELWTLLRVGRRVEEHDHTWFGLAPTFSASQDQNINAFACLLRPIINKPSIDLLAANNHEVINKYSRNINETVATRWGHSNTSVHQHSRSH